MIRTPLLATAAGLVALAGALGTGRVASAQGQFGTIKGRVVWAGAELPKAELKVKKGDTSAKDAAVCAAHDIPSEDYVVDPATKGLANAFAYVATPKGKNPEAAKALVDKQPKVVMDQQGCRFVPHALAMSKDQVLEFKSSDPVGHNVRYNGFNIGGFNQMLAPNGTQDVKMSGAERNPVQIQCDIHPWMNAYFMVFDHPFFAVTKADGSFEIHGVPAGAQKLVVREDKGKFITPGGRNGIAVEVKPGDIVDVGEIQLKP